jgi:hypothetical protein
MHRLGIEKEQITPVDAAKAGGPRQTAIPELLSRIRLRRDFVSRTISAAMTHRFKGDSLHHEICW